MTENRYLVRLNAPESIARGYNGRTITIFTDSQAAFKALESVTVKSKFSNAWDASMNKRHTTQFKYCGCQGILGNEKADTPFTGPEPILGLQYSVVKRAIEDWMERKYTECWKSGKDFKHSKALMEGPQQGRATKLLNMSRQQLSVVIGLLTGHLGLNGHLYKIGKI